MAKTIQEIQDEMKKNSTAWHGASVDEQNRLHQANKTLQGQIDGAGKTSTAFDSRTGTWGGSVDAPTSAGAPTSYTAQNGQKKGGLDDLGQVDYSKQWETAVGGGASLSELERIYNGRQDKIGGGGAYGQFANDAKGQQMQEVLEQMRRQEKEEENKRYIEEMNRQKQQMALDALRNAYNKNVAGIDRAQDAIAPEYQSARNQAAGQAELQKKNFAEYAAAHGLNSGASGQAQMSFGNSLQKNLSDISGKEASTQADLELQRSQMESDYNSAIAQAKAQGNYELAQQLYAEKVRQDEQYLQQIQFDAQQALQKEQIAWGKQMDGVATDQWNKSFESERGQDDRAWAMKQAQEMAQYGNFDGYKALGYSDTDIQGMKDYWNWMQAQAVKTGTSSRSSGSGGGSSGAQKPTLTYSQTMEAISRGEITPGVLEAYEYYNKAPFEEQTVQIASYSQLGKVAQGILNGAAGNNMTPDKLASAVEQRLQQGLITEAEASFILKSVGH